MIGCSVLFSSSLEVSAAYDPENMLSDDYYHNNTRLNVLHYPNLDSVLDDNSVDYILFQDDSYAPRKRSFDFGATGEYLSNTLKFTDFYPWSVRDSHAWMGWGGSLSNDATAETYIDTPFVFENITELHIAFAILQRNGQLPSNCNWEYDVTYPDGDVFTWETSFANVAGQLLYVCNDGNNYAYVHVDLEYSFPVTVSFNRIKLRGNWRDQYLTACFSTPYVVYGDPVPVVTSTTSGPVVTTTVGTTYLIPSIPDYPNDPDDDDDDLPWLLSLIVKALENLGSVIVDGVKTLFVPSSFVFTDFYADFSDMLDDRLGVVSLADGIVDDLVLDASQDIIEMDSVTFPGVVVPLSIVGEDDPVDFEMPEVEVPLNPDPSGGLDPLFEAIKYIIDIVSTLAVIMMLRKRFDREIIGGEAE